MHGGRNLESATNPLGWPSSVSHYSGDGHVYISVVDDVDVVDDVNDGEDEADGGSGNVDDVWRCWLWGVM